jgi:phosphoribosylaminoimidazole carboxylase (NCAIR synthetase)
LYGKKPRPGRKVGHITVGGESADEVKHRVEKLRTLLH